jgi:hypothetical protein
LFKFIRHLRGEWLAFRALVAAIESAGTVPEERVMLTARRVLFIKETYEHELAFGEMIGDVYGDRTVRDAVIMQLINVGGFWKCRAALCESRRDRQDAAFNLAIVSAAATALAQQEWTRETEHASIINRYIRDKTRDAIFHCGVEIEAGDELPADALLKQVKTG